MKTRIKNSFILRALYAGLGLILAGRGMAQTFTNLHSFTEPINFANNDGANPSGCLIISGNSLYGTAAYGGSSGNGTVFALNTDGTGFTNLHDVILTWPAKAVGFTLQSTTNLVSSANWITV